jgi:hypothetical protein
VLNGWLRTTSRSTHPSSAEAASVLQVWVHRWRVRHGRNAVQDRNVFMETNSWEPPSQDSLLDFGGGPRRVFNPWTTRQLQLRWPPGRGIDLPLAASDHSHAVNMTSPAPYGGGDGCPDSSSGGRGRRRWRGHRDRRAAAAAAVANASKVIRGCLPTNAASRRMSQLWGEVFPPPRSGLHESRGASRRLIRPKS